MVEESPTPKLTRQAGVWGVPRGTLHIRNCSLAAPSSGTEDKGCHKYHPVPLGMCAGRRSNGYYRQATIDATQVAPCYGHTHPRSNPAEAQPQCQGCRVQGQGACLSTLVVPTECVMDRHAPLPILSGWSPAVTEKMAKEEGIFHTHRRQGSHADQLQVAHLSMGAWGSSDESTNVVARTGRLRCRASGVAVRSVRPPSDCKPQCDPPSPSSMPSSVLPANPIITALEGYTVYRKKRTDETTTPWSRRTRTSIEKDEAEKELEEKNGVGTRDFKISGEHKVSTMWAAKSGSTPRTNLGRQNFRDPRTGPSQTDLTMQIRAEKGNVVNCHEKGCYTRWFEEEEIKNVHLSDAGTEIDIQKQVRQISQRHLGEVFTLSAEGRTLVEPSVGEAFSLSPESRILVEDDLGAHEDIDTTSEQTTCPQQGEGCPDGDKGQQLMASSCGGDEPSTNNGTCEGTLKCEDNHEQNGRDVSNHESRSHEYRPCQESELEQAVGEEGLSQERDESLTIESPCDEDPTCEGNHETEGRAVNDHETGSHVDDRYHRSESKQTDMGSDSFNDVKVNQQKKYPWTAPRVILQYLELAMGQGDPTTWSIDDYDDAESWEENQWEPRAEHRKDIEASTNQYHKLSHALYQLESAIDDLLARQKSDEQCGQLMQERQDIKGKVRGQCMEMYKEVEGIAETNDNDVDVEKAKAQVKYIAMFEKGKKKATRRKRVQEDSSDEEEEQNMLVCNMTGPKWESLPYPIIIDSGPCASVMPTGWCEHVPLRETAQSQAGECFRAANGQNIHNHGEKALSMITKEGAMRDMRFTICDVSKALGSVSQMCRAGHKVAFNPPWDPAGSYIYNISRQERRCGSKNKMAYMSRARRWHPRDDRAP